MQALFRKLFWATRRRQKDAELREELEFHVAQEAADRRAAGLPDDRAHDIARRELGNVTMVIEDTRAAWGGFPACSPARPR
jgi:hypothetical protein